MAAFPVPAAFRATALSAPVLTSAEANEDYARVLSAANGRATLAPLPTASAVSSPPLPPPSSQTELAEAERLASDISTAVTLTADWDVVGHEKDLIRGPKGESYLELSERNGLLKWNYPDAKLGENIKTGKVNLVVEEAHLSFMVPSAATQTITLKGHTASRNDAGYIENARNDISLKVTAKEIASANGSVSDLKLVERPFNADSVRFLSNYGHLLRGNLQKSYLRLPAGESGVPMASVPVKSLLYQSYLHMMNVADSVSFANSQQGARDDLFISLPLKDVQTVVNNTEELLNSHFLVVDPANLSVVISPAQSQLLNGKLQKASFSTAFSVPTNLAPGEFAHSGQLTIKARAFVITPSGGK